VSEGQRGIDELLHSLIGQSMGRSTVMIERGPVSFFADAVLSRSPIYRSPEAAAGAGLPAIPAPPTFPIAMESWGKFAEDQPADAGSSTALGEVLGPLMAQGGIILHGEQEFVYERPVVVGDVLDGESRVVEAYQKESKGHTMTFIVTETAWVDHGTGEPVVTSRNNIIHRA
jgi:acyl dehydratase